MPHRNLSDGVTYMIMQQKPVAHEIGTMPTEAPYNNCNRTNHRTYISVHQTETSYQRQEYTPAAIATLRQAVTTHPATSWRPLLYAWNMYHVRDGDDYDCIPYDRDGIHQHCIRPLLW